MSNNAAAISFQMFYEPGKAFAALREKSHAWLPLLAIMIGTAGMMYWYFQTVDFPWMVDQAAAARPDMTAEEREAMHQVMSPTMMTWSALGGVLLGTPIAYALYALYYLLAGKFLGSDISYGKWFALTAWTSLPRLLVMPLMALQIMTSNGRVAMEDLSMVSLNFLLFQLPVGHPWGGFLNTLDLPLLWSAALTVIGLRVWTGRSLGTCITVSVLPLLVIFGAWAAKIAMFG